MQTMDSFSLSLRVTSFVLEASAMLPLSKVAAVSLHLELWISKDRSHHFLTDTGERRGKWKNLASESRVVGYRTFEAAINLEWRLARFLTPSSSSLRYGIFMTISRLIETFLDSNFFSSFFFFHLLLSRSLPGAFVLHRNAYCLVVSTRRYFHPSRSSNLRVLKNQWIVLAATVAIPRRSNLSQGSSLSLPLVFNVTKRLGRFFSPPRLLDRLIAFSTRTNNHFDDTSTILTSLCPRTEK